MKYLFLLFLILFSYLSVHSQSTIVYDPDEELFNKALELFTKGEYAAARESFEDYLEHYATGLQRQDVYYMRALSSLNLFHEDAEDQLLSFIEENPIHPKTEHAYYVLGNHYFRQNNYAKAVTYYDKVDIAALTADESDEMRFKAGYANFSRQKFDEALKYFDQQKRHSRRYASAASYYAGFIEYQNGEFDKAYADLTRAEESDAYASVVPYMIANVLYKQHKYDALLQYINEVEVRPNVSQKADLALLKAEAYYFSNDYKEASQAYKQYVDAQRRNIEAPIAYRYGRSLYSIDNYTDAIDPLRRAAASSDSIAGDASFLLGLSYIKEKRANEALTAFGQALKLNKNKPLEDESLNQLAKVNLELDQAKQAIAHFEEFLEKYPQSEYQREASDLLSQSYLYTNDYKLALDYLSGKSNMTPQMERVFQQASYLQGVEYFNANRYKQAMEMFNKSLKYPREPGIEAKARLWLAEAYSVERQYEPAIDQYLRVIGSRQGNENDIVQQARYGLGYAYYNTNQYPKALINFKSYVNAPKAQSFPAYADAMLRLGDSYYATKAYNEAVNAYDKVLNLSGRTDRDYAYLQKGIVSGIAGNYEQAVASFDQIIKNYSTSSRYYDDAIFQKGQLNLEEGKYQEAVAGFSKLVDEKPGSRLVPYALIKRASSYYNQQKYEQAKDDYVAVIENYISHPAAKQVLLPLQEVLNFLGQNNQFENYFAKYKSAHPEKDGLEGVEYETAKNMYFNQDYDKAIRHLQGFIANYPDDTRVEEAKFYLAESYYRKGMNQEAMDQYMQLVDKKDFSQRNRVINRLADINFQLSNFQMAVNNYDILEELAANKKELYNALAGMMESYFLLGQYDSTTVHATEVIDRAMVNAGAFNKAMLYKGKAAMAKGQFEQAVNFFQQAIDNARDINAAEAGYLIGDILFQQKKYRESIDRLISFGKDFSSYEEWVGRAYLLIAENYFHLKDYFQAKGTLQSLIDNFPGEDIKVKARNRLKEIQKTEQEENNKKPVTDTLEIDIKDIDN